MNFGIHPHVRILACLLIVGLFVSCETNNMNRSFGIREAPRVLLQVPEIRHPFTMVGGLAFVQMDVGDVTGYWFMVDTGSSHTHFTHALLNELSASPGVHVEEREMAGLAIWSGAGGTHVNFDMTAYRIPEARLGDAVFQKFDVFKMRTEVRDRIFLQYMKGRKFGGMLGFSFFKKVLLTMDYRRQELRLREGSLPPSDGKTVLPLARRELLGRLRDEALRPSYLPTDIAWTVGELDGTGVVVLLDTGAEGAMAMSYRVKKRLAGKQKTISVPDEMGQIQGIGGSEKMRLMYLHGTLALGEHRLTGEEVSVLSAGAFREPILVVGSPVLRRYIVTYDQRRRVVRLQ